MELETTAEERAELLEWCKGSGNRYPGSIWITIPRLLRDINRLLAERAAPLPAEVEVEEAITILRRISGLLANEIPGENSSETEALLDIVAILARWPKEAGWQPISTAPKDGSLFLVTDRDTLGAYAVVFFDDSKPDFCWGCPEGINLATGWPTDWRPLPPAPKEEK